MTLESDAKFEEKLTSRLENNKGSLTDFYPSFWKSHTWDF